MDSTTSPVAEKLLATDLSDLLGLQELTELERYAYLSDIGETIFEGAIQRLIKDMSEEKLDAFNAFLDSEPEPEKMYEYLSQHHPEFDTYFQEEVVSFKRDAIDLLGTTA